MSSVEIIAEVAELTDVPGSWGVAARRDGVLVCMVIFGGSDAKRRAVVYAREKYALVLPPRVRAASTLPSAQEFQGV